MIEEPTQTEASDVERAVAWSERHRDAWVRIPTRVAWAMLPDVLPLRIKQLKRQYEHLQNDLAATQGLLRRTELLLFAEREKAERLESYGKELAAEMERLRATGAK